MTRKDRLFKIHYADGRVDGPVSTQVIRDLIQVQAISPSDLLTADGEPLRPYTQIPDLMDLAPLANSAGAASSGVKVRRTTNLPPIQRVTGANPAVGAGPRITGSIPAVGGGITQFPGAGGSNPQISLRGGSNPGIQAGTWGNTPASNPGIPAGGGFGQPVRGASNPGIAVGGPMIARRFSPEMVALGPINLRDKLLTSDLPEILGLPMEAPARLWKQACYDRALQVKAAFTAPKDMEEKLAVADVLSILLASQEVLCDPARAGGYLQGRGSNGRPLSFQNYSFQGQLNFAFAEEADLFKLGRQLDARLAGLGVIASPEEQPAAPPPGPTSGSMPAMPPLGRAPLVTAPPPMVAQQPAAPSLPPGFSSQPLAPQPAAPLGGGLRPMQPAPGGLRPMAAPPSMMDDDDDLGDKTLTVDAASLGFLGLGAQTQEQPDQLGDDEIEVMASIPGHQDHDEPLRRAPASSPGLAARLAQRHSGGGHIAADTPSGDGALESPDEWITDGDLPALDDLVPMGSPSGALGAVTYPKTTRELEALRVRSTQDIPALGSLPQRFAMPEEWLKASAEDLRDRLLVSNLYGNLGVDVNSAPEECSEAYQVRIAQIQEKYQPMFLPLEQQLVLTDVIEILYRSCAILIDPEARPTYVNQQPPPSFQNFVKFSFAEESLFSTAGQIRRARRLNGPPGKRALITNEMREVRLGSGQGGALPEGGAMGGLRAAPIRGPEVEEVSRVINYTDLQAAAANLAQLQAQRPTGQMPMMGTGGGTSPKTTSTIPVQGGGPGPKGPATALSLPKMEETKAPAPPPKKPPAKQTPRSKEEEEKRRRREMFKGGGQSFGREEGDPFKGPLAFGVGDNARALKHTLPFVVVGFGLCFLVVEVLGFGKKELSLDPNEQMLFIRPAIYILLALVGLVAVRRESPARIGLIPKIVPAVIALPFGILMGFIAKTMARFDVDASAQMPKLIPFLLLRAFGESVFFQGYLNRTALIEFQTPPLAVFLTSFYFGMFTMSYSALLGASSVGGMLYSVLIYTFGMGFPIAFIYAQTRSILVTTVCQFFVYYMAALGGLERAQSILGHVGDVVP